MRRVRLVLDLLLAFCETFATGWVRLKDFTVKVMNRRVELDVRMNQTLSSSTTNEVSYTLYLLLFGDQLLCVHGETIFSTT